MKIFITIVCGQQNKQYTNNLLQVLSGNNRTILIHLSNIMFCVSHTFRSISQVHREPLQTPKNMINSLINSPINRFMTFSPKFRMMQNRKSQSLKRQAER